MPERCEPDPQEACSCHTPEQAALSFSEEAIIRIQEASICLGRLHRLILMEGVAPGKAQLSYLHQAASDIESLVVVINQLSERMIEG